MFSPKCCYAGSVVLFRVLYAWRPYSDFEDQLLVTVLGGNGIENSRELLAFELHWNSLSVDSFMIQATMAEIKLFRRQHEKVFVATGNSKTDKHEQSTTAPITW
jgi:hypothetical protein